MKYYLTRDSFRDEVDLRIAMLNDIIGDAIADGIIIPEHLQIICETLPADTFDALARTIRYIRAMALNEDI